MLVEHHLLSILIDVKNRLTRPKVNPELQHDEMEFWAESYEESMVLAGVAKDAFSEYGASWERRSPYLWGGSMVVAGEKIGIVVAVYSQKGDNGLYIKCGPTGRAGM